jgi:bifunctional DNase/RNase
VSDAAAGRAEAPAPGTAVRTVEEEPPTAQAGGAEPSPEPAGPDTGPAPPDRPGSEISGAGHPVREEGSSGEDMSQEESSGEDMSPEESSGEEIGPQFGDFRTALVSAVTVDLPNQHPTVVLRESESPRRQLSFSVSLQDGVVLSHVIRRIPTPRPLTHELLSEVLKGFEIDVVAVRLVGRLGAVYFAELDLRGSRGRSVHSCRPSDALAVALVQPVAVPILIDNRLFEAIGDVTPPGPATSPS